MSGIGAKLLVAELLHDEVCDYHYGFFELDGFMTRDSP
jgi:hypothetical protein